MLGRSREYRGEDLPVYGVTTYFTRIPIQADEEQVEAEVEVCFVIEAEERLIGAMRLSRSSLALLSATLGQTLGQAEAYWDDTPPA